MPRILLLGGGVGTGRPGREGVLAEEAGDFEGGFGGEGVLEEGFDQLFLVAGWSCNSLLAIFLALLLDLGDFEEELLGVGTHLGSGARLDDILNKFPIFSMEHHR